MLTLNSTIIILKSLHISASQTLASEDASGQSSSTDTAETGMKAKALSVSGFVPFTNAQHLAELFKLAEAVENGARVIYRISNPTATALGIKQVRFSGKIDATEQETSRQWKVSFNLTEYRSVPEKKEQRTPDKIAAQQGGANSSAIGEGTVIASADTSPPETEVELTGLTGFLKTVDSALA